MSVRTAYLTGGASGIGLAVTERLVRRGIKVAIADINLNGAKAAAATLNAQVGAELVSPYQVDVSCWESQRETFSKVVEELGRIDLVLPIAGIGENQRWLRSDDKTTEFIKPDLTVLDVNLTGVLYTSSLAVQQMKRQEKDNDGFRGKSMLTVNHGQEAGNRRYARVELAVAN